MTRPSKENEETLRKELETFGLSETEINTYFALLSHGEATTNTVSQDADVTQRAVYGIAERLENRGFVRVNDHASPTTIRALPPEKAMANLSERLKSITPLLQERFNETQPQTPEVKMMKTRETVLKHIRSAISQAEHEVILAIPEHVYLEVQSELQAAVSRDVLVLLLLGDLDVPEGDGSRFAGSADVVHFWDESVPVLYTVDDQLAMIGSAAVVSGTHNDEDAVEVSNSRLTGTVLSTYLGTYWPASTELYVTDPCSLPRTFDWFRQAVLHAMLHHINGTDLWATIETSTGREISGPITNIRQALVEPATNDFSVETSLTIQTDNREIRIGGPDSFIEEYEAQSVTLKSDP